MDVPIKTLWIDESGDCGFKFERGSAQFLVIVAVYIYTKEDEIIQSVELLKSQSGLNVGFEFKFSRCKNALKQECLTTIAALPLEYKAIVIDKKHLQAPALQYHPHELYCEALRRLLYDNNPPLEGATVVLDEATAKIHHREFHGMLKKYLSKRIVQKVKQARSRSTVMVQVADMIAGSIFRMHEKGDSHWYQMIRSRERILMIF